MNRKGIRKLYALPLIVVFLALFALLRAEAARPVILDHARGCGAFCANESIGNGTIYKLSDNYFKFTGTGQAVLIDVDRVFKVGTPTDTLQLALYSGCTTPEVGSLVATSSVSGAAVSSTPATVSFPISAVISSTSTNYCVVLSRTGSQNGSNYFRTQSEYMQATSTPDNVWRYRDPGPAWFVNSPEDRQLSFTIYGADAGLSFASPTDSSTITDFGQWSVDWGEDAPPGTMRVLYSRTSSSTPELHDDASFSPYVSAYPFPIDKQNILIYPPLTSPATYWAKIEILDAGEAVLASSSLIHFDVLYPGESIGGGTPEGTSTLVSTCDPSSGFWSYSVCNVLVFLFVPPTSTFSAYMGLWDGIKNKPPMGYLVAANAALTSISTSTPAYTMPDFSAIDAPFLSTVRNALSILLWIFFLVIVFSRIKHLDV